MNDRSEASITARDGAHLHGTCFVPAGAPRGAVIVLHGIGSDGGSMSGFAGVLTAHGYIALAPDSRARNTHGILERHDIAQWIAWLDEKFHAPAYFGYGGSFGAAILLQSLNVVEPPFRAVVADSPWADLRSYYRDHLPQRLRLPRSMGGPVTGALFAYHRLRYSLNLHEASAENELGVARTPVLLIHGTADKVIPIEHSRRLHAANPEFTELWEVEGAAHVDAWRVAKTEFERRVLDWFQDH